MYIILSRDSFARLDIIRCVEQPDEHRQDGCEWCGGKRSNGNLFRYGSETDNGHSYWDDKAFCCKSCRDNFYS